MFDAAGKQRPSRPSRWRDCQRFAIEPIISAYQHLENELCPTLYQKDNISAFITIRARIEGETDLQAACVNMTSVAGRFPIQDASVWLLPHDQYDQHCWTICKHRRTPLSSPIALGLAQIYTQNGYTYSYNTDLMMAALRAY